MLHPVGHLFQWSGREPARPPLRLAAARDQASPLQHLEMFGDGRHAHLEWLGQLRNRSFARGQTCQDGPPCRIGEGGEGGAEVIGGLMILNQYVT